MTPDSPPPAGPVGPPPTETGSNIAPGQGVYRLSGNAGEEDRRDTSVVLRGAEAKAEAGNVTVAIGEASAAIVESSQATDFATAVLETNQSRFELLNARILAVEHVLRSLKHVEPGIGHNRGPKGFEPASAE